ncbi:MAG: peptidase M28, partial [Alistipes sp.]|nr:peptidase M28 [Alistipes sp.]
MKKLLILAFALLPTLGWGQNAAVKKIMEMAREDNRTMQHLDILCNRFGGRPIGSDAYENAAEWAMRCFREWGYEVEYEKAGELSVGFNRGGWWGQMYGEENMHLHFATPSFTAGTKGPQRGHVVIEPRTQEQLNRVKHQLKGSWVLLNGHNRGWSFGYGKFWDERREQIIKSNAEAEKWNREHAGEDGEKKPIDDDTAPLFHNQMVEAGILGFVQKGSTPITALYDRDVIRENIPFDSLP